jgi:hypothetical protein
MKPNNVAEALDSLHALLFAAGSDLEHYLLSPQDYPQDYLPEYFESVKDAVLDAHMLVTWIKDNK